MKWILCKSMQTACNSPHLGRMLPVSSKNPSKGGFCLKLYEFELFSDQIKGKIPESWSCSQEYLFPYSLPFVFYNEEDFI